MDRRVFIKDLGKLGVAMVVVSACGTDRIGSSASTVAATTGSSVTGGPSSSAAPTTLPATTIGAPPTGLTTWERVRLGSVSAYVLARGGEATIVDTGVSGSAPAIGDSLGQIGLGWADVSHVVATHLHPDHIGSWADVMVAASGAAGYAGHADLPAISSPRPLSGLGDGDMVFELRVIATPGHTPGHISLLDESAGILVAGDSLNGTDGTGLTGANPQYTPDMATANESIAKMAGFDYSVVLVGHGDPVVENGSSLVGALVTG
ncbi:MAG: MBL fold metallo-hydrolase [Acidimicrobiia bacterium]|nr:MBL fold metallo-hydrolase [Acidimicrobiia bacterium]MDH5504319.1 MBL fold metallo-hydrolase [Acidimicrobiia bacterium]